MSKVAPLLLVIGAELQSRLALILDFSPSAGHASCWAVLQKFVHVLGRFLFIILFDLALVRILLLASVDLGFTHGFAPLLRT
jgi:hypothetical protein